MGTYFVIGAVVLLLVMILIDSNQEQVCNAAQPGQKSDGTD